MISDCDKRRRKNPEKSDRSNSLRSGSASIFGSAVSSLFESSANKSLTSIIHPLERLEPTEIESSPPPAPPSIFDSTSSGELKKSVQLKRWERETEKLSACNKGQFYIFYANGVICRVQCNFSCVKGYRGEEVSWDNEWLTIRYEMHFGHENKKKD